MQISFSLWISLRHIFDQSFFFLFKKFAHSEEEIKHHPKIAETFCQMTNSLACMYVDVEEFAKAEPLHKEVLEVREK